MSPLYWSILLLIAAMIVMALELFVPSGGVLGFLAAASCIGSIVVAFQAGPGAGVTMLLATALLLPIVLAAAIKVWPRTPFGRLIIQKAPTRDEVLPEERDLTPLIGRQGTARTPMLPSGVVAIGDEQFEAMTRGEALEAGDRVEVVGLSTKWLVVRRAVAQAAAEEPAQADQPPEPQDAGDDLAKSLENLELGSLDDPAS